MKYIYIIIKGERSILKVAYKFYIRLYTIRHNQRRSPRSKMEQREERVEVSRVLVSGGTSVDQDMLCASCQLLPLSPESCGMCQCVLCGTCRKDRCPICGGHGFSRLPKMAMKQYEQLKLQCSNKKNGCDTTLNIADVLDHELQCMFKMIECTYCKEAIKSQEFAEHMANCPMGTVPCVRCGDIFLRKDQPQHSCISALKKRNDSLTQRIEGLEDELDQARGQSQNLEERIAFLERLLALQYPEEIKMSPGAGANDMRVYQKFVSGDESGNIKIWDRRNGTVLKTHSVGSGIMKIIQIAENVLCLATKKGKISIWNIEKGIQIGSIEAHSDVVKDIVKVKNGQLASCSNDKLIKIWEIGRLLSSDRNNPHSVGGSQSQSAPKECKMKLQGHTDWVDVLSPLSAHRLASGSYDHTIRIWDLSSGLCLKTLSDHAGYVHSLLPLRDGRLVSASGDSYLMIWNMITYQCMSTISAQAGNSNWSKTLFELPDGRVTSASSDGYSIKLWNLTDHKSTTMKAHRDRIDVVRALDSTHVVSGSADGQIIIWDITSVTPKMNVNNGVRVVSILEI